MFRTAAALSDDGKLIEKMISVVETMQILIVLPGISRKECPNKQCLHLSWRCLINRNSNKNIQCVINDLTKRSSIRYVWIC